MDERWRVRRIVSVPVISRHPAPGWVEHDPESLLHSVRTALRRVMKGVGPAEVRGVGLACQRSTCLFWDAGSQKPLTPALSWQDRRGEAICNTLSRHAEDIIRKTGLRLSPHYAASKIRWLLDQSSGLRHKAERGQARFGTLDAYLLFRLTEGESWSTDPTQAARTLLMDLKRLDWDPELLDLFGVPYCALPPIRPSSFPAGEIPVGKARLRIAATLGDQQSALIGVGCRRRGEAVINYGTGAFVALNTGQRPARIPGLLTSVAWSSEQDVHYLLEGTVNAAGSAVEWLEAILGHARRSLSKTKDFQGLPLVVPALNGLAAPHWRSDVGAAIFDLHSGVGPGELRTATLAGIACRIREIVEVMGRGRIPVNRIVAAGGLARSDDLVRMQAGLLSRPLFRSSVEEATALGAALLAGHTAGAWSLHDRSSPGPPAEIVRPSLQRSEARRYFKRFGQSMKRILS